MTREAIPAELRERPQWIVHRSKVPFRSVAPATKADTTKPNTWGSFELACEVVARGHAEGIGYVFAADDPYVGIDLDDCVDDEGQLQPEAAQLVAELDSYTERSPSGTGLHVFVRAKLPGNAGRRSGKVEVYSRARYFTITGEQLDGTPGEIHERQDELDALLASFPVPAAAVTDDDAWQRDSGPLTTEDEELINRAQEAGNGEKFTRLWSGDTSDHDDDHSRADLALCGQLAFWTGPDPGRIDRVFRHSGLYREKWDRDDYARRTIARALVDRVEIEDFGPGRRPTEPNPIGCSVRSNSSSNSNVDSDRGIENPDSDSADDEPPWPEVSAELSKLIDAIGISARDLRATVSEEPNWLVPGVIAPGWTVKVAAREKTGKGTFCAYLIGKLERGEPTIFGLAYAEPINTLVYTEEPEDTIREKLANFSVEKATIVYHWQLAGRTWEEKAAALVVKALRNGCRVIYPDNISRASGATSEDEAGVGLGKKIGVLSELARPFGISVLPDHHHRKGGGRIEDKSRGGTAAGGVTEVNIDMVRVGDSTSRKRRLVAQGRIAATNWEKTIVLSDDGTDYYLLDDDEALEDYKLDKLRQREQWTAKSFADEIDRTEDTARKYLNDSRHVTKVNGGYLDEDTGRRSDLFRVTEPTDTEQDYIDEPDQPSI